VSRVRQRGGGESGRGVRDRARHPRGDYGGVASSDEQRGRGALRIIIGGSVLWEWSGV
jgi:hypothetical protein